MVQAGGLPHAKTGHLGPLLFHFWAALEGPAALPRPHSIAGTFKLELIRLTKLAILRCIAAVRVDLRSGLPQHAVSKARPDVAIFDPSSRLERRVLGTQLHPSWTYIPPSNHSVA